MPQSLTRYENWLRQGGWRRGAGGNWYLPETHPHLHLGPSFLAYSWRQQRDGVTHTRSIQMVRDSRLAEFSRGLDAIADDYREDEEMRRRMIREAREAAVSIFAYSWDEVGDL